MASEDTTIDMATLGALPSNSGTPVGARQSRDRRVPKARDMEPGEMSTLRKLFAKFLGEEAREPEHAQDQTVEKAEVNYGPGKDESRCKNCTHFEAEKLGCEIVKGRISPDDWCERFKSKIAQDTPASAAGVIVRSPSGDCLFVKRSTAGDHAGEWAFPGGKVEGNETHVAAARRELKEETGYDALRLHSFPRDVNLKIAGDSKVRFSTFLHHASDMFQPKLNNEHTEFKWAKPDQAPQPLHPGVKALLSADKIKEVLAMDPLTTKGREIMQNMKNKYGEEKGERVFYASENKGTISGVEGHDQAGATWREGNMPQGKWTETRRDIPERWLDDTTSSSQHQGSWKDPAKLNTVKNHVERYPDPEQWNAYDCDCAQDTIMAFDRAMQRQTDQDGRLHVARTPISKATVNPYLGKEIPKYQELNLDANKTYRLWRHPDELKKGAKTFNGVPLLIKHVPVNADDHRPHLVVGALGTDAEFDRPYLYNSLVSWAKDAIDGIDNGKQKQLSASYHYDADMTPGVTPDGQSYDGVMRNIRGNHVALVREGRAGPDVAVADSVHGWQEPVGAWR